MNAPNMVVVNGVRYRAEDARRLGLVADGKTLTANSRQAPAAGQDSVGDPPADPPTGNDANGGVGEKPKKSGSKADWIDYALANGKTAEDLDGLSRDQIADLFPDPITTN